MQPLRTNIFENTWLYIFFKNTRTQNFVTIRGSLFQILEISDRLTSLSISLLFAKNFVETKSKNWKIRRLMIENWINKFYGEYECALGQACFKNVPNVVVKRQIKQIIFSFVFFQIAPTLVQGCILYGTYIAQHIYFRLYFDAWIWCLIRIPHWVGGKVTFIWLVYKNVVSHG